MAWTIPSTWSAGAILTAAQLNTQLRDNLLAISGAWTSFTSTWSGSLGNGTKTGYYTRIGRTIHYAIVVNWGSSTSHTATTQTLTLPVAEASAMSLGGFPVGLVGVFDASAAAASALGFAFINSGGVIALQSYSSGIANRMTDTNPMTWAAGDYLYVNGTYQANTD